jgi:2-amino-4-hydroxy-6-hydroxymethyldihydropteridine diphosphokinase
MIFIGIGSNLSGPRGDSPRRNCHEAILALNAAGIEITQRSRWYRTAPVPMSDQPWYVNGVVGAETSNAGPAAILDLLHQIEIEFGRFRSVRNASRALDLDLLDFGGRVSTGKEGVILPHPRMHERAFVLWPLSEIAPEWCHPISKASVFDLIAKLPSSQYAEPIP